MFLCVLWCIRYSHPKISLGESAEYIRSSITKTLDSFTVVAEFSQRQDAWDCLSFGEHLSIVKCFLCLWVLCTWVHSAARIRIWSFCGRVMSRTPTKQNNSSPEMARHELTQIWGFVAIPLLPNQDGSLNFAILQHAEQLGDVEELCGDLGPITDWRTICHSRKVPGSVAQFFWDVARFPYFSMEDADEALQKLKDANVSDYMIAYVWLAMKSATQKLWHESGDAIFGDKNCWLKSSEVLRT